MCVGLAIPRSKTSLILFNMYLIEERIYRKHGKQDDEN